jgi:CDGSH-type Zn-finger protein
MDESEQLPETIIRAYPDGPLLIRGDFQLLDEDGEPIDLQRRTIALCRCGKSASKPFCDGLHSLSRRRSGSAAGPDCAAHGRARIGNRWNMGL